VEEHKNSISFLLSLLFPVYLFKKLSFFNFALQMCSYGLDFKEQKTARPRDQVMRAFYLHFFTETNWLNAFVCFDFTNSCADKINLTL
jgi:hypothetical protein